MRVKTAYIEPEDYFPRKLRKKYKLGEYATEKKKRKTEKKKKRRKEKQIVSCGGIRMTRPLRIFEKLKREKK